MEIEETSLAAKKKPQVGFSDTSSDDKENAPASPSSKGLINKEKRKSKRAKKTQFSEFVKDVSNTNRFQSLAEDSEEENDPEVMKPIYDKFSKGPFLTLTKYKMGNKFRETSLGYRDST